MTTVTPILTVTVTGRKTKRQKLTNTTGNKLTGSSVWGALEKARDKNGKRMFTQSEIQAITEAHSNLNNGYGASSVKNGTTIDLSQAIIAAGLGHKFGVLTKPEPQQQPAQQTATNPIQITVVSRRDARKNKPQKGDTDIKATSFEAGLLRLTDASGKNIFTENQAYQINMANNKLQKQQHGTYDDRKIHNGTEIDAMAAIVAAGFGEMIGIQPDGTTSAVTALIVEDIPTDASTNNPFAPKAEESAEVAPEATDETPEEVAPDVTETPDKAEEVATTPAPVVTETTDKAEEVETTPPPVVTETTNKAEEVETTPPPVVTETTNKAEEVATTPAPVVTETTNKAEDVETTPAPVVTETKDKATEVKAPEADTTVAPAEPTTAAAPQAPEAKAIADITTILGDEKMTPADKKKTVAAYIAKCKTPAEKEAMIKNLVGHFTTDGNIDAKNIPALEALISAIPTKEAQIRIELQLGAKLKDLVGKYDAVYNGPNAAQKSLSAIKGAKEQGAAMAAQAYTIAEPWGDDQTAVTNYLNGAKTPEIKAHAIASIYGKEVDKTGTNTDAFYGATYSIGSTEERTLINRFLPQYGTKLDVEGCIKDETSGSREKDLLRHVHQFN